MVLTNNPDCNKKTNYHSMEVPDAIKKRNQNNNYKRSVPAI